MFDKSTTKKANLKLEISWHQTIQWEKFNIKFYELLHVWGNVKSNSLTDSALS